VQSSNYGVAHGTEHLAAEGRAMSNASNTPYLKLQGLEKQFGEVPTIQGIDLDIQRGEFVVFVGPSGCGKSTLLRLIAGLETIDQGTIELDGRDITQLASSKRDLAMVFQSYALYPHMSVYDNMSFALRMAKVDPY
jgi:multiple sugar transport system ATP-binding protein